MGNWPTDNGSTSVLYSGREQPFVFYATSEVIGRLSSYGWLRKALTLPGHLTSFSSSFD